MYINIGKYTAKALLSGWHPTAGQNLLGDGEGGCYTAVPRTVHGLAF